MPRVDPFKNFRFLLEIDGIVQGGFTECTGFGSQIEVVEYREGGEPATVRKLTGRVTYPDMTLRWGITDARELYDWHYAAVSGRIERRNGSIILQNDVGEEQVRWNFFDAWPSQYDAPDLNATSNEVAIDALTIAYERLERA